MDKSKITGQSTNPQAELLAKLMAEMPEIFSEGKIDSKKLKATLGEDVLTDQERYGLTWAGKAECFKKIQETTTNTLKPCRDESVDFDKTKNIFIEGDNLQVLKVLQKSYYGKVKMIYIDPPYNTGNDFIYNDKFSRTKREELIANGSIDDEGNVINHDLYRQNTRDSGHFHSNWLNMMYPRLFLARNLLRQDGVIFVSIDDNEVKNLRAMMDEIFGEENFVAQIVVQLNPRGRHLDDFIAKTHEYILAYGRDASNEGTIEALEKEGRMLEEYDKEDVDGKKYREIGLRNRNQAFNRKTRPKLFYPLYVDPATGHVSLQQDKEHSVEILPITPDNVETCWTWGREKVKADGNLLDARKVEDGTWRIFRKDYLIDETGKTAGTLSKSVWIDSEINNDYGKKAIRDLFGESIMDFPKSPALIEKLVKIGLGKNDIVMDFFAGSGTTAHAVMQLNVEDEGNRKWICVQLPEKCRDGTAALKSGFTTIADMAKERIRRASWKIFTERTSTIKTVFKIADGDTKELDKEKKRYQEWVKSNPQFGFKSFKLDESNFKIWNTQIADVKQLEQQLIEFIDNVRPESTTEDMLYELILKSGLELNVSIEEKKADGGKYQRIGEGSLIICLADKLTKPLFEAILKDKPEKIITLDRAFANNDQLKTNMMLEAEHAGVKEFKVI